MKKKERKLIEFIGKEMPEKDLYGRIESQIVKKKEKRKKKKGIVLISSLTGVAAIGVVVAMVLIQPFGDQKNAMLGPDATGDGKTDITETESRPAMGEFDEISGGTAGNEDAYSKTLTATEWSDLKNYASWLELLDGKMYDKNQNLITEFESLYASVHGQDRYPSTKNRIEVEIRDQNGDSFASASAILYDENGTELYRSMTDVKGKCYLYTAEERSLEGLKLDIGYLENRVSYSVEERSGVYVLPGERPSVQKIDVAFLIDTTGSMGDELTYIGNELNGIIRQIVSEEANLSLDIGVSFYRDRGDTYVTRSFDFSANYEQVIADIQAQNASGGGDYEEAVDLGLKSIGELSWRPDSAKMVFHIFDAPGHSDYYSDIYQHYIDFAAEGIRYIPCAASGLDKVGEFIAREGAILTGGTYVSLTDHSGIGNGHQDITTPSDTEIEYFNDLIVRLIKAYSFQTTEEKIIHSCVLPKR